MNTTFHKIIILLILALLLASCDSELRSDKVEQRIIFPSYVIDYNAAQTILEAKVCFQSDNESGEIIKLSKNSSIHFNNENLKWNSGVYSLKKNDEKNLPDTLVFQYQNDDENIFINRLHLKSIEFSDCTLNKNASNQLNFKGKKIEDDESVTLILTSGDLHYEILLTETENNTLLIEAANLGEVTRGTYAGQLLRTTYSTDVNAMDRGGSIEINYLSEIHKVIIQ